MNFFERNNKLKDKGYTLVELLVYIGLLSLILVVMTTFMGSIFEVKLESDSTTSVEQNSIYLMNRIPIDLRSSTAINSPVGDGSTSTSLSIVVGGNNWVYSTASGVLRVQTNSGTYDLTTNEVLISNLQFTRNGNAITMIYTLTSQTNTNNTNYSQNFSQTVTLR